jgi:hypothetical protein
LSNHTPGAVDFSARDNNKDKRYQMKAGWTTSEKFNYEGVSTDAPAPLPEGLYRARFAEAKPQATKEGKPMIKLTVEVFENEDGESVGKRRITDNVVLSQAALFRVKILADALDIEPLADSSLESAEAWCRDIVDAGKSGVWVKIKHESYIGRDNQERTTHRVDRYLNDAKVGTADAPENGTSPKRRPRAAASAAS